MTNKGRLLDIDRARGLAIFLVVLGHLVGGELPLGNAWYVTMEKMIYRFHMPFFMYLSGFIMFHTYRGVDSPAAYGQYAWSKFARLAPGFVFFGILILLGKIALSNYLHVDRVPPSFVTGVVEILIIPGSSSAGSLWFIYVLMMLYMIYPLLLSLTGGRLWPIIALGVVLYFVPATPYFMIEDVFQYLLFFSLGALVASRYEQYTAWIDRYRYLLLLVFAGSFALIWTDMTKANSKFIIGLLSLPAVHSLVRGAVVSRWDFLIRWGTLSYAIYLLNTLAIGFTKSVILQFTDWHYHNFLWIAPILLVAGLFGSIFTKLYIFPYIKPLDRITN